MNTRFLKRASAAVGLSLCAAAVFVLAQSTRPVAAQQNSQAQPAQQTPQGQPGAAPAAPILSPGPAAARTPKNADEFDAYFKQVSNWGRWGRTTSSGP